VWRQQPARVVGATRVPPVPMGWGGCSQPEVMRGGRRAEPARTGAARRRALRAGVVVGGAPRHTFGDEMAAGVRGSRHEEPRQARPGRAEEATQHGRQAGRW